MVSSILQDLVLILILTITVLLISHKLRLPSLIGIILSGTLAGPHGLRLVGDVDLVELLSEIGLILLLFAIGMQFSLKRFQTMRGTFLFGGCLQVLLTILAGFAVSRTIGRPVGEALFFGCLLSLSSTAIVLNAIVDRSEEHTPFGLVVTSILIFQDIIAIPMILIIPLLAGTSEWRDLSFMWIIGKGLLIILGVFFISLKVVPRIFYHIAKTHSHSLFLMTVLTVCFTTAWLASQFGLSLALGAFLAGLILSDTQYSHQAMGEVLPVKDVFMSFFFISIGMLVDIQFVLEHPFYIIAVTLGVILLKTTCASLALLLLRLPLRTSILSGLALSQIGEFSFVLAKSGMNNHLGIGPNYQLFLAISLLTMVTTPLMIAIAPKIALWIETLPFSHALRQGSKRKAKSLDGGDAVHLDLTDHVIIVGFGFLGQSLAHCCRAAHIDYAIVDLDPDTCEAARRAGEPIYFGDATHDTVLKHMCVKKAFAVAIAINDRAATNRIIHLTRQQNAAVFILTRTHRLKERLEMYSLGADVVAVHEQEIAITLATELLRDRTIPETLITELIHWIRQREPRPLPHRRDKLRNHPLL